MKALKRIVNGTSAAVLGLSSLITLSLTGVAQATVNNCTWTGASSNNFNTAGNWSSCGSTVPQAGDNLVFDITSLSSSKTLTNNIVGLSVNNITFQGTNSIGYNFTIGGNALTLAGNVTVAAGVSGILNTASLTLAGNPTMNVGSSAWLDVDTAVGGTGNITKTGSGTVYFDLDNTFTGTITANAGTLNVGSAAAMGNSANAVTVNDGADITLGGCSPFTFVNPLTLTGASSNPSGGQYPLAKLSAYGACSGGGGEDEMYGTIIGTGDGYTLAGAVTLGSDVTFEGIHNNNKITGPLSGSHQITLPSTNYYGGSLVVASSNNTSGTANGTYMVSPTVQTLSDNQSTHSVGIASGATITLDGQRGDTFVSKGGVLKGTGQVNSLAATTGGTVAPGHSPGKMTVTTTLTLYNGATYQAELKDKSVGNFDQLVVGSASDTTGNDVLLGDGTPADGYPTLDVELYSGASIKAGDTFEIINNQSKTAVKGIFNNLPEGATFKVGNGTMKISYVGGDGNDVVLTAMTNISAPDTGFALISSHPLATLGVTVAAAGSIVVLAQNRKLRLAPVRAKTTRRRK